MSSNGDFVQNTSNGVRRCPKIGFYSPSYVENISSMCISLDEIDRRLLALLQEDALLSVDALAECVIGSEMTVGDGSSAWKQNAL